jgi:tripartite-type tricarboxylate transporter receptor subunit TctC
VPYGPGGGADNFARPLAQRLSEQLGQQVIVDNRAGASGMIGSGAVAQSAPDGYTLLANFASLYLAPLEVANPAYDPVKAFTPITLAATTPIIIVVHPSLPVKNMKELVDYARSNPGMLNYVTAGTGTQQHLTGESLALATKTKMVHIAYRGGNQAMTDLLGGQVKMGILILSTVLPQIQAGKLRAIAVIEGQRSKLFPEFPTIAESGLPGFSMPSTFIGVWGPAGLPPALATRINNEVQKAMQVPAVRAALDSTGYEPVKSNPEEFAVQGKQTYEMFQRMVKDAGLTP